MHETEPLDIPRFLFVVKWSKRRFYGGWWRVRVVISDELAVGVEPAALDVRVAPELAAEATKPESLDEVLVQNRQGCRPAPLRKFAEFIDRQPTLRNAEIAERVVVPRPS